MFHQFICEGDASVIPAASAALDMRQWHPLVLVFNLPRVVGLLVN
jgi:hypothetical protein